MLTLSNAGKRAITKPYRSRELQLQGYTGSRHPVQRWVQLRRALPQASALIAQTSKVEVKYRLPGVKELTWLLFRFSTELNQTEQALLAFVRAEAELDKAWKLSQQFRELLQDKDVAKFQSWLLACLAGEV